MDELDDMIQRQHLKDQRNDNDPDNDHRNNNVISEKSNVDAELRDAKERISVLEKELDDTNKVSKLQLEELDDEMKQLKEKMKSQQMDTNQKIKLKDTIINELQLKVQRLEGSINKTMDVDTIESAKQKVFEARMDAKSV